MMKPTPTTCMATSLLMPNREQAMACSLFGISNDVAMQVVGVGFIIGVVQDSVETALNSAGDVLFAATAEFYEWRKQGKEIKF